MAVTTQMIKELRALTQAGVMECKRALDETGGDMEKAAAILRERALAAAAKKAERKAAEGLVEAYIHTGGKLGVLVEVNCETDFVARTDEFEALCHDLALQVAASAPKWVAREDVPADVIEAEKAEYRSQFGDDPKPPQIMERIMQGKLAKFYEENCLLEQPFIRDDSQKIKDVVTEAIARLGENIVVKRFSRFEIS
ncbi:MAG: translation elongation factor Ts [Anaerolineae bacterium]|nr:translation elongation factor Ts [Anaerolineae bacterium]